MWTTENRHRYDRSQLRYPSGLTDAEWQLIEPLIPSAKRGGGKRTVNMREVVNCVIYGNCSPRVAGYRVRLRRPSPGSRGEAIALALGNKAGQDSIRAAVWSQLMVVG